MMKKLEITDVNRMEFLERRYVNLYKTTSFDGPEICTCEVLKGNRNDISSYLYDGSTYREAIDKAIQSEEIKERLENNKMTIDEQYKLVRRHVVLGDFAFLTEFLDVEISKVMTTIYSYRALSEKFVREYKDEENKNLLILKFEGEEKELINKLIWEGQKHD